MTTNTQQLFQAYDELNHIVVQNPIWEQNFTPVQVMFEEKKHRPDANIMIYGVYNAGKSTVINALLGEEIAATGDVPLTYEVAEYQCGHFAIWDTPGIDAPKEHEQVTQEQLLKADAIVFVVNPLGVVEEEKTLSVLMDLFVQGKKVFLLFNEKHELSDEDFFKLKDQTKQQLQILAQGRGLENVLKDIPILKLNAKLAIDSKQIQNDDLLEYSGYFDFEKALHQFVSSITPDKTYSRLKNALLGFVQDILEDLQKNAQSELVKQYDQLIHAVSGEKIEVRGYMGDIVGRYQDELYRNVKSWLQDEAIAEQLQANVGQWIETKSQLLETELVQKLEEVQFRVSQGIDQLEAFLPKLSVNAIQVDGVALEEEDFGDLAVQTKASKFELNPEQMKLAKIAVEKAVTTESVVMALNMVKQYLPTLMKGIGKKTIEKWAVMVAGKAVPALSIAVDVGMSLYSIFSEDAETKALREHHEQVELARERRQQQIEEIAIQVSDQLRAGFSQAMNNVIDEFFSGLIGKLNQVKREFSEQDQSNSDLIAEVLQVKRQAVNA